MRTYRVYTNLLRFSHSTVYILRLFPAPDDEICQERPSRPTEIHIEYVLFEGGRYLKTVRRKDKIKGAVSPSLWSRPNYQLQYTVYSTVLRNGHIIHTVLDSLLYIWFLKAFIYNIQ